MASPWDNAQWKSTTRQGARVRKHIKRAASRASRRNNLNDHERTRGPRGLKSAAWYY